MDACHVEQEDRNARLVAEFLNLLLEEFVEMNGGDASGRRVCNQERGPARRREVFDVFANVRNDLSMTVRRLPEEIVAAGCNHDQFVAGEAPALAKEELDLQAGVPGNLTRRRERPRAEARWR